MKTVSPADLANVRPEALRERLARMPATISHCVLGVSETTGHYIAAAYFTDTGDTDQPDMSAELAFDAVLRAVEDCAKFLRLVGPAVLLAYEEDGGTLAKMGHDLWLTRNGHGAGFWDRSYLQEVGRYGGQVCTLGEHLSVLARALGECNLIAGDDGLLYLEG